MANKFKNIEFITDGNDNVTHVVIPRDQLHPEGSAAILDSIEKLEAKIKKQREQVCKED